MEFFRANPETEVVFTLWYAPGSGYPEHIVFGTLGLGMLQHRTNRITVLRPECLFTRCEDPDQLVYSLPS